ncbi:MAG: 5'-nucleotidase C-terminal domain-containing protein [Fimbriimonadaceae bacterium]|nr:5'-nucleotidase C-terminal domain-containing protein [Fimbriimonadaceae bacterium]
MKRYLFLGIALVLTVVAFAQKSPSNSAHLPSQAAADLIRDAAGADGAFLAAGLVKDKFDSDDLSTLMQFGDDEIVVVALKGSQIKQAFERSIALYPEANTSFLQVSGFEIEFDGKADPNSRIRSITAGGSRLDENKTYNIAMPATLGRGGLGYFKIWDKNKITSTLSGMTVEKALKGKKSAESRARWVNISSQS